jgi:hypothetical protein
VNELDDTFHTQGVLLEVMKTPKAKEEKPEAIKVLPGQEVLPESEGAYTQWWPANFGWT